MKTENFPMKRSKQLSLRWPSVGRMAAKQADKEDLVDQDLMKQSQCVQMDLSQKDLVDQDLMVKSLKGLAERKRDALL